jgi:PAS domain S-box-containing protein
MIKKVLIVDDISANLYMLETLLKGYGLEVTSAENGKDALDKARLNPPDMIVTDILMPVMDGYALCRQWKSDDNLKHIPLVFYTATYTDPKDEVFALSLGADRFILKPQEPDIFMNMLKEVLGEKYAARQVVTQPLGEEMESFRQYNEILFKKLEKKILDLENANQELKALEEQYRLSFENVTDVIYTIDTDLNIISMSPSVERILGYKPQDFIGRPVSDLGNILTPESFNQAIADTVPVLKGETIPTAVYQFIAKDGTIKYGEVSGAAIMCRDKIIGIISVARDITDRKLAEEVLRESERKLKEVQEMAHLGFWYLDVKTGDVEWSEEVYKIFRLDPKEFTPHIDSILALSPWPEDHQRDKEIINRAMENHSPGFYEQKFLLPDKSIGYYYSTFQGNYDVKGELISIAGTVLDITERKIAEEATIRMAREWQMTFDSANDAIWLLDKEQSVLRSNKMSELFFKRPCGELVGIHCWEIVHGTTAPIPECPILRAKKSLCRETTELQIGDGWFSITVDPILDANGQYNGAVHMVRDITAQKDAESQREAAHEEIRNLNENLEQKIKERTVELRKNIDLLEETNRAFVGRELRMIELKERIAELEKKQT